VALDSKVLSLFFRFDVSGIFLHEFMKDIVYHAHKELYEVQCLKIY